MMRFERRAVKRRSTGAARNDVVPAHVWEVLQATGEVAATRLHDLLTSKKFDHLSARDQGTLINLALTRAYGSPDAPVRREVQVALTGTDAVSIALERLAGIVTLPEHAPPTILHADIPRIGSSAVDADSDSDGDGDA